MDQPKPPFASFSFSMTDRAIGRRVLRLALQPDTGDYRMHVESGVGATTEETFDRVVPRATAEALRDALASLDAFNWDAEYGDVRAPGTRRWNLSIVFEEGVFSVQSMGASDTPAGFDELLEALYRMDLPRPRQAGTPADAAAMGMPDFGRLAGSMPTDGFDPQMLEQMQETLNLMRDDPARFSAQIREEFSQLPRAQQDTMIDMLSASGMASREWWERFLRG